MNARRQNALATLAMEAVTGAHLKVGPGMRLKRGADGVTITSRKTRRPSGATHPFYIKSNGEIFVGTVNGVIPKIGEDFIGIGGPALDFSGHEDGYVYIEVTIDVTYELEWFASFDVVGAIKIIGSSTPKTDTSTKVYYLVAQVVGGVVIHTQPCTHNMQFVMCASSKNEAHASWTSAS